MDWCGHNKNNHAWIIIISISVSAKEEVKRNIIIITIQYNRSIWMYGGHDQDSEKKCLRNGME